MTRWKCSSLKFYIIVIIVLYIILFTFTNRVNTNNKPIINLESSKHNVFYDIAESNQHLSRREDLKGYSFLSFPKKCWGSRIKPSLKFKEIIKDFYIFSAFYDDRIKPSIRFVSSNRMTITPRLTCVFEFNDVVYNEDIYYYEMCENHRRTFGGNILSCKVPTELYHLGIPCKVKVVAIGGGDFFEINHITDKNRKGKFGSCIPPLFSDFHFSKFIEFIELNRILGVHQFFIYFTEKYEENLAKVLKYYQNINIIKLIPWKLPENIKERIWYHGQALAIHDCLYRFMHSVDYLIFQDLDEFFIPSIQYKLSDLIIEIDAENIGGFCFECFYLKQSEYGNDDSLWTLTFKKRTLKGTNQLSKCLVKADKVFEMGIHHISKFIYNTSFVMNVKSHQGKLFHLRKCKDMFGDICYKNIQETTIIDRYGSSLRESVDYHSEKMGLLN